MMFNTSIKNPLETETVGQRKERKARESEGSIPSSRSSFSTRLETKSVKSNKSNKFNVFEIFSRSPKTPMASPDDPLERSVKQDWDISPSELPASPVPFPPTSQSLAQWPYTRGYSELSTSPSVCKPKAVNSQPSRPLDSSSSTPQETHQGMWSPQSFAFAKATGRTKPDTPVEATDLVSRVELDRNIAGQSTKHRRDWSNSDRPLIASYPSSSSTCSTSRSDTFSAPRSIPEEMHRPNIPNMHESSMPAESEQHERVDTPATAVSAEPELDLIPSVSPLLHSRPKSESTYLRRPVPQRDPIRQDDPKFSADIRPLEDGVPPMLRLMQVASNEIHCQRLCEHWDGVSFDLAQLINFEKRLWALNGLKRLDNPLLKGGSLRNVSGFPLLGGDATKIMGDGEKLLHICEDEAESWLQAATSHNSKIHCLLPSEPSGLTSQWNSRPNMDTNYWADIPTLPYGDSSMDLISSRSMPLLLRSSQWPVFVQECVRVLRPGGVLEITILDPMPRNCGPLLRQWTARNLVLSLERRFLVTYPAMIIPLLLDDVSDFGRRESMTFAYSATADEETHELRLTSKDFVGAQPQSDEADRRGKHDLQQLRTAVGRHFYRALYNDLVHEVSRRLPGNSELETPRESIRHWWWKDLAIVKECKEQGTVFEMVTYKCRKKSPA